MCFQWDIRLTFGELGMFAHFTRKMHGNQKTRKRERLKIHDLASKKQMLVCLLLGKMHGNLKTRKRERLIKLELGKMHAGIRHSKNECLRTDAYRYPSVKVINAQAVLAHIKEGANIAVILGE